MGAEGHVSTEVGARLSAIDRSSPTPLYYQLEQALLAEIGNAGVYQPGDPLLSEAELCETYGVSRSVVRQTLKNLAQAGHIVTRRGQGSFVAESKVSERFVQHAVGFYDDLSRSGLDVRSQVIRQEIAGVPAEAREIAGVPAEARDFLGVPTAIRIDRVRFVDGRVVAYVTTYLPADRCPGLEKSDLANGSLYSHLREVYGLEIASGRRTIEVVEAEGEVAEHLKVKSGAPLLLLKSASRSGDGSPLEWFEAWHRPDRTRFEIEIAPRIDVADRPAAQPQFVADSTPTSRLFVDLESELRESRAMAVVRAPRYGDGGRIAGALASGGVRIVEFAVTGANSFRAIEQARQGAEQATIGASSVLHIDDARRAIDAGAQFIVAPARVARLMDSDLGIPILLAGYTPSEILDAYELTSGPVKLFPAGTAGPDYVRSLATAMPQVKLIPSGGIDREIVGNYLAAGAFAVSIGASLCPVDAVIDVDAVELEKRAAEVRNQVLRSIR